jgi:cephalosporin hydroxylase
LIKKFRNKQSMNSEFANEVKENIRRLGEAKDLPEKSLEWMLAAGVAGNYTYNFSWLGRPIIQYPQDMVAMQELIWEIRPDLIIETGIAHGGSLILSASLLALLDMADAIASGSTIDPKVSGRKVLGIDIDIRDHNRAAIEAHPMASRIQMIQGSSVAPEVVEQVKQVAAGYKCVLVCLDSNHTHEHVLAELEAYAPLVSIGSYCVVYDTLVEDMPSGMFQDRPWGKGDNPKTAVWEYLRNLGENESPLRFEINHEIENKLLITVAGDGYLRRVA